MNRILKATQNHETENMPMANNRRTFTSFLKMLRMCLALCFFSNLLLAQLTYKELRVQYDSAWTFKNLQIIPVRFKAGSGLPGTGTAIGPGSLSLSEAMLKNKIKVQEIQYKNGADANWLQVTNQSKQDVVIQSGEILDGGKQDRMIGETKILPAGSTDYLNVYCVEKRRWTDKPEKFRTAGVANSDLQKSMHIKKRQSEIWKEIDRQYAANNKKSETYSYVDLYKNASQDDSDYIRYFASKYNATDSNFAGFIFVTGNHIMNTELFCTARLTQLAFKNILSSHVQTARATGAPPKVTLAKAKEFMDKVILDEPSQKTYVTAHGKLQISNGKVIRLVAYDE